MLIEVGKRDGTRALINMNNVFSIESGKDEYGNDVLVFKGNDGTRTLYTVADPKIWELARKCHRQG